MQKIIYVFLIIIILCAFPKMVYGTNETINTDDVLASQQDALGINSFIEEADKYTSDVYEDIDMGELFSSAISGNINNETIVKSILKAIRR